MIFPSWKNLLNWKSLRLYYSLSYSLSKEENKRKTKHAFEVYRCTFQAIPTQRK